MYIAKTAIIAGKEMDLLSTATYANAIASTVRQHNISRPIVFLMTEDIRAYRGLQRYIEDNPNKNWRLYAYEPAISRAYVDQSNSSRSPMADAELVFFSE